MDTKNGSSYSDSSERKNEDIGNTLIRYSSEPSLDKKCVFEVSVVEDCSINHHNSNATSDEIGETFCTASYAEMDKSDGMETYEKSSLGSENLISTRSRAFTEHREQSGYTADNSGSGSSTANVSEDDVSPPRSFESKLFSSELRNDTYISSCSYGKNTTNSYASNTQTSSSTQQIGKNRQMSDAVRRYFDSLVEHNKTIAKNQQHITTQSETYEGKFASLPNIPNPSPRFQYNYVNPCDIWERKALIEDGDNGTLNPLEDFSGIRSSLSNINLMQGPQSDRLYFIENRSSNESDINDMSKKIFKNDDPVLTDMEEIQLNPKLSPIEDESGKDEMLNDILEVMTCSELPNNNENIRKNNSSLKNREGISPTLDTSSMNKENHPNESDVSQYKTFKGSWSYSPARERESEIIKSTSPAASPTRTLINVDINLTKRPASPDDNLSPESHDMMQDVKKQKMES